MQLDLSDPRAQVPSGLKVSFAFLSNVAEETCADVLFIQVSSHVLSSLVFELTLFLSVVRYRSKKASCWVALLDAALGATLT